DDGVVVVQMRPPALRPTWRLLLLPARIWRWRRHPRVDEAAAWEAMVEPVRALYERDLADASWRELVQTLRAASVVPPRVIAYRLRGLSDAVAVLWLIGLLWSVRRLDLLGDLLSGTDNMTAETSRALDALAARIRTDPALASLFANHPPAALTSLLAEQHPGFLADFHRFLDQYGHRETTSPLLATQPTWRDAPQVVLGLLKVRSAAPPTPPPRPAWRVAREELLGHWLLRSTPARHLADRWLTRARRAFRARENGRFYLTLALPVVYGTIR